LANSTDNASAAQAVTRGASQAECFESKILTSFSSKNDCFSGLTTGVKNQFIYAFAIIEWMVC